MSGHIEEYEVLNVIGTGSFGTCYKVQKKSNGHLYVWKAIGYGGMSEEKKQLLVSEVNLLSGLRHPNIVQYFDRIIHKETAILYIVMEWCKGGDLATLINKCKKRSSFLDEGFIWRVLYQMCRALQECHWKVPNVTILHRDIKPANVFLDEAGNVKLGDFGLARILDNDGSFAQTLVGTPYYMSPEVIRGGKYNKKSDIWSLGCLIYELCSLSPPFIGPNIKYLASKIEEGKFSRIPAHYSDDLQKMISLLLSVDHKYRPTIEMILHHPTVVTHIAQETFKTMTKKHEDSITELHSNSRKEINSVPNIVQNLHDLHLPSSCRNPFPGETEGENCEEDTNEKIHGLWLNRFHILKQRESSLRLKELAIDERERAVTKKEKQVALLDRLTRDKMTRADVYLRQCREARSVASVKNLQHRQYSTTNIDPDTSLSADPGDTSILPTSTKLNPEYVTKPSPFVRVNSEKHVRFNTLPITKPKVKQCRNPQPPAKQAMPQFIHQSRELPGPPRMSNQVLHDIQEHIPLKVSKIHDRKELQENGIKNPFHGLETANEDNFRNGVLVALNSKYTSRSSNLNIRPPSCMEDLAVWLENKRHAHHLTGTVRTQRNVGKENTAVRSAEIHQRVTKSVGVSAAIVPSTHKSVIGSLSSFR